MNGLVLDVDTHMLMLHWNKKKEGGGVSADGVESIFHRSHHRWWASQLTQWPTWCFLWDSFRQSFYDSDRASHYRLMVKKEEVCVYTESNAIRKGGMMKKNQRVTLSQVFHFTPA